MPSFRIRGFSFRIRRYIVGNLGAPASSVQYFDLQPQMLHWKTLSGSTVLRRRNPNPEMLKSIRFSTCSCLCFSCTLFNVRSVEMADQTHRRRFRLRGRTKAEWDRKGWVKEPANLVGPKNQAKTCPQDLFPVALLSLLSNMEMSVARHLALACCSLQIWFCPQVKPGNALNNPMCPVVMWTYCAPRVPISRPPQGS